MRERNTRKTRHKIYQVGKDANESSAKQIAIINGRFTKLG